MLKSVPTVLVGLLVIVVILLTMCAFQVRFTETAVVTRFDQIKKVIEPQQAGLHWKWPWPVDRVHRYDARLRSFDTEFRQLGTEDQKTLIVTAYATWRIADGEVFLKAIGREDAAAPKINDLLENQVSIVMRTHPLSHLVNTDPKQMKYAQIEAAILKGIREPAAQNYGIDIVSVGIKRLGIPESVTKEVFTRMKEDRQKTITELKAEGEAKAKEIRADADEIAAKILARAMAYAKTIEGEGDAEAAKYYSIFAENEEFSNFLKKRETIQKIFDAGQITLVLDAATIMPFDILTQGTASAGDDKADAASRAVLGPGRSPGGGKQQP